MDKFLRKHITHYGKCLLLLMSSLFLICNIDLSLLLYRQISIYFNRVRSSFFCVNNFNNSTCGNKPFNSHRNYLFCLVSKIIAFALCINVCVCVYENMFFQNWQISKEQDENFNFMVVIATERKIKINID